MKWYRGVIVLLVLLAVACTDPVVPKYPEDETNKKDGEIPDTSLVVDYSGVRLA
jgi:hypothetical protein